MIGHGLVLGSAPSPRRSAVSRLRRTVSGLLLLAALLSPTSTARADDPAPRERGFRLIDETDHWLDLSDFLDSVYGFVPVVSPITEPAVGYGAAAAVIFVDRREPTDEESAPRPNLATLGGLATENGTQGLFAAHLGNWRAGRLRTLVALADASIELRFFGLSGLGPEDEESVGYSIQMRGGIAGGSYRFGEMPLWVGLQYASMRTRVDLSEEPALSAPSIPETDRDLELAALTPSLTFDTRDNFFTPVRGWYLDLSLPLFRDFLGSDREFERAMLNALHFRPLSERTFFGARGSARISSDGTPFFLRPFVVLRGVEAIRYQGEQAADVEAELRWQFHPRLSLVGFGGVGAARSRPDDGWEQRTVTAGGLGLRYLVARQHGLHMGLDLAAGPDEPIVYVVFGSAWMRP